MTNKQQGQQTQQGQQGQQTQQRQQNKKNKQKDIHFFVSKFDGPASPNNGMEACERTMNTLLHFQQSTQEQLEDLAQRSLAAGPLSTALLADMIEDRLTALRDLEQQIKDARVHYVGQFLIWQGAIERQGLSLHEQPPLRHGPRLPSSPLLYRDGDRWTIRTDERGLYSSYPFWLEHLDALLEGREPLDEGSPNWATAEALGLTDEEAKGLTDEEARAKIDRNEVPPMGRNPHGREEGSLHAPP